MLSQEERQEIVDDEHLKLLALGYLISAVLSALASLFGLLYAAMGAVFMVLPASATQSGDAPPEVVGWLFGAFGLVFFALFLALAWAKYRTATLLKQRRSRTFCMVVAALTCFGIPWGTAIGAMTFMVLGRESVQRRFDAAPAA